jgi:ATP-dependent Clp protease ATP-binding subunit ClpA
MFERFTEPARFVVMGARAEAQAFGHPVVGTQHLLLRLLDPLAGVSAQVLDGAGVTRAQVLDGIDQLAGRPDVALGPADAEALRSIGIDLDAVLGAIGTSFGPAALDRLRDDGRLGRRRRLGRPTDRRSDRIGANLGRLVFAQRSKKVLELALREAIRLDHRYIGTEHLLLGLLREGDGLAAQILVENGQSLADLRQRTESALLDAA